MAAEKAEIRVKGQAFKGFFAAIERLHGKDIVDEMQRDLSPELAETLRYGQLIASGWYAVAWYRELHGAAQRVCGSAPGLARDIGREATRHDLNTVYRLLLRMFSPETLLKQAPVLFKMYCQGGDLEVLEMGKGSGRLRYFNCFGCDRNIYDDMLGSNEVMLEACGAKDVKLLVTGGGKRGDSELEVAAKWSQTD